MYSEINSITKHFFGEADSEKVSAEQLRDFLDRFPYVSVARYLLAHKTKDQTDSNDLLTAELYINNPIWLHALLENDWQETAHSNLPAAEPAESRPAAAENTVAVTARPTAEHGSVMFQSYHTIDYFASQGIRLQQTDLGNDKLGQQLKSFTEWLKSMKKLPQKPGENGMADEAGQRIVIQSAAHSIEEKEVLTEAMAEVWSKQGNFDKARDIYNKLSLQNPDKRAYFAAKIDQLK